MGGQGRDSSAERRHVVHCRGTGPSGGAGPPTTASTGVPSRGSSISTGPRPSLLYLGGWTRQRPMAQSRPRRHRGRPQGRPEVPRPAKRALQSATLPSTTASSKSTPLCRQPPSPLPHARCTRHSSADRCLAAGLDRLPRIPTALTRDGGLDPPAQRRRPARPSRHPAPRAMTVPHKAPGAPLGRSLRLEVAPRHPLSPLLRRPGRPTRSNAGPTTSRAQRSRPAGRPPLPGLPLLSAVAMADIPPGRSPNAGGRAKAHAPGAPNTRGQTNPDALPRWSLPMPTRESELGTAARAHIGLCPPSAREAPRRRQRAEGAKRGLWLCSGGRGATHQARPQLSTGFRGRGVGGRHITSGST